MTISLEAYLADKPHLRSYLTSGDASQWIAAVIGLTGNLFAELPESDGDALFAELQQVYPSAYQAWVDQLEAQVKPGEVGLEMNRFDQQALSGLR
ncbi:hypothetical protein A2973_04630 [Candidatus Gottesmanbacteria bacterium RIFCSPLOWO2_01_FULL_49_10]|uniref:Uncharacterized protein n=1 Tax=Candidatus Gottesmanbacteria bacterium RIFCSPLOWO2_01_FULL_49_10 TaxID=1798396 RepID=A0A1F6AZQ8_9BACT|nr:MAG: hypothetical protein A2973_04630 [Candidatus Gottesmanbacteria bacterium RIFCSPLOWO2_01_FULL_49_10]